uniref:Uncharacterized protein n=1 Tax=Anopheles christyi TaxID=43041 RepID=A0A182K0V9_9DIPT
MGGPRVVWWCWLVVTLCSVPYLLASGFEASGQGESTYEEYEDESPYRGGYELVDPDPDSSLEEWAVHEDVLDPITDDDISYSGYEYEDPLDDAGGVELSISSTVIKPSATTVTEAGNGTMVEAGTQTMSTSTAVVLEDGLSTPLLLPDRVVAEGALGSMSSSFAPPPPEPTTEEDDNTCRGRESIRLDVGP